MAIQDNPRRMIEPYTPEKKERIRQMFNSFLEGDDDDLKDQQETYELLQKAYYESRGLQRPASS